MVRSICSLVDPGAAQGRGKVELVGLCSNLPPPHRSVAMERRKVMRAREGVTVLQIDDMVARGIARAHICGAVRWSGAATTDLARRIALR